MRGLFDETHIKGMTLQNRLVRSATWEGMCESDGRPTSKLVDCYRDLARGGVGLIITGYTFVRPDGKELRGKMGLHSDAFADDLRALTKAVHRENGRIAVQLVHAGGQTSTAAAGRQPLGPSAVKVEQFPEVPAVMSKQDIDEVVDAFGAAAERARECGFDALQLHGAHGYLINQFLSPLTNQRTDEYGGDIANRCRFLMKVYQKVRSRVGDDFPVMIKLNGADNVPGGLELVDAVFAAKALAAAGIDAIEVSGGTPASGDLNPVRKNIRNPKQEAYNIDLALQIKSSVKCPVMSVGGFRSFEVAERMVVQRGIDYIAMARPFIREPHLAERWRQGNRTPATCISCNECFQPGLKEGGIYCVVERREQEKRTRGRA
jgi:2,4-dienoyl-CoA reductase-like NADH-dependent reductase (Old Yellow Enzyme family)